MNKLRLIQCGMGGMGKTWWKNATGDSPDFELAAIVDVADAPLAEAGDAVGVGPERRFRSLEAALDAVEADAVLTVTPPVVHAQHAELAFARGLHLMTEKPIADNFDNAKRMVRLARDAGRQLVVTQNYRFSGAMQTLRNTLASRPVGDLGHGHLDFYIGADFTGSFRETMEFPLLVDMAIHHMDLIRAVTGRNISRVTAMSFRPAWSWYQHDPGLKMLLELDGGLPFSYAGDWSALGKQTGWNGNWRLQCAEGSIDSEKDQITVNRCERWGRNPTSAQIEHEKPPLVGQARLLKDFADAIRTGRPAETSGADNLWSFGAVIAGVTSARERRTVDVSEIVGGA
jgi:predicted dehydrogenase